MSESKRAINILVRNGHLTTALKSIRPPLVSIELP